jgi:hypothetical protein
MCSSGEMSAFFALSSIALAGIVYKSGRPNQMVVAILYFGAMEALQTVQYMFVARPEDGFSMCKNSTNQFLTVVGYLHIVFQPLFCNMGIFAATLTRRDVIRNRFRRDIVFRLCYVAAA